MSHHAVLPPGSANRSVALAILVFSTLFMGCSRNEGSPASVEQSGDRSRAPGIEVRVTLDPSLANRVSPDDKVFVFARAAEGPKAPLAVAQKQVRDLPATVLLDDSTAMMPEGRLSAVSEIVVGARISRSGNAVARAGDLEGSAGPVATGTTGPVEVVIAREIRDARPAMPNLLPFLDGNGTTAKTDHPRSAKRLPVNVPQEVAARWKAVELAVTPAGGQTKQLRVPVGKEAAVPDTSAVVRIVAFVPAFQITDSGVTSSSNEPDNPAALVRVVEPGRPAVEGWVFQKLPEFNTLAGRALHVRLVGGLADAAK